VFERFTTQARQVVVLAQEEARQLRHPAIGTEHLLLGLLGNGDSDSPARQALQQRGLQAATVRQRVIAIVDGGLDPHALAFLGIDLDQVRQATEAAFGPGALDARGPVRSGHIPFTPRAKKVLELSLREAVRLKHDHIGAGHLLLGLLREGGGRATRIIADAGIDLDDLRAEVARLITTQAA
jgi:ATP-dependent Clp protease ATP-binding subunit ClpA